MDAVKEKKGTMDLTEGSSFKKIIVFSIPLIIGNIFQLFYSWADAIVIGKTDGAVAYGSITASMPVIFLILTVTNGFLTGAVVILSQLFSKKDEVGIKKSLNTILITMLVASLLVTVIGYFGTKPLLKLLKVSPEQIEGTTAYLQIYFLGSIAVVMYNTFNMILKSVGNSAAPLVILISSTVLNLGLDILFVAVFHMGVVGVAVATLIAQFLSAVLAFVYMQIKIPILRVRLKDFRFSGEYFKSINKAAIPSLIQQLVTSSGFLVVNMLVNGHGAELTIAYGLGNRIDEIMNMEIQSFGTTLSTFAAQNKGAGKTERIKKGFWQTLLITFVTTVILGGLVLIFRHDIASLFISLDSSATEGTNVDIQSVIGITGTFISIMVPSYFVLAVMHLTTRLLSGAGDTVTAMSVNIFSFAVRITAAFVLNHFFGYVGVFAASGTAWFAGMIWALVRYFGNKWQNKDLFSNLKSPPSQSSDEENFPIVAATNLNPEND